MPDPTTHATIPVEPQGADRATLVDEPGMSAIGALLAPEPASPWERYEDIGRIGHGGMGEVRRVRDRVMGRVLAMKLIHPDAGDSPALRARFLAEARLTACLQHPGIVPVHDCGALPDGSLWFTMKEVRGRTFRRVVEALHGGSLTRAALWRALEMYLRVCEAVGYAHEQGVIHRDLKPENVMVGEFGEVLVMDWGIGKTAARFMEEEPSRDVPSDDLGPRTQAGQVLGTPAYMPPEQACGELDRVGPASDVYALGAILYEVMCGRPPYEGSPRAVWAQVLAGPPKALAARCEAELPAELVALCDRAMARDPQDRPRSAIALAEEIRSFLDGARRRERALSLVGEARDLAPRIEALRARACDLRARARAEIARLQPFDPAEEKARGWALEDEARALELTATLEDVAWRQRLHAALSEDPELAEAHADLADAHAAELRAAEGARDVEASARAEAQLRAHDRGRYAAVLRGDGALTLVTDPEGAEVRLSRYVERMRRLVPEPIGHLGRTPLHDVSLPRGSYLVEVVAPGFRVTRYPVLIGRGERWDGARPGDREPFVVPLLREIDLDEDDVYVPAGWSWSGGDPLAGESLPGRRLWIDGFVIRRHPVTQAEYLIFLNDLVDRGLADEAARACPRAGASIAGSVDVPLFATDDRGRFGPGPHTPRERARHPVASMTWHSAAAYATWYAARTKRPYRLPGELEREKAARGADGRFMPWGDQPEPTWACMLSSRPGAPSQAPVDDYPTDESPHGARGLAGNVRDWCGETWSPDGPPTTHDIARFCPADGADPALRAIRGGMFGVASAMCRAASRFAAHPDQRISAVGLRLVRPIP